MLLLCNAYIIVLSYKIGGSGELPWDHFFLILVRALFLYCDISVRYDMLNSMANIFRLKLALGSMDL